MRDDRNTSILQTCEVETFHGISEAGDTCP